MASAWLKLSHSGRVPNRPRIREWMEEKLSSLSLVALGQAACHTTRERGRLRRLQLRSQPRKAMMTTMISSLARVFLVDKWLHFSCLHHFR